MQDRAVKRLFYLIGQPGSGKTSVFDVLFGQLPSFKTDQPFIHTQYENGVQLGAKRQAFGGTDVLPMNVQPKVEEWLKYTLVTNVVAEGDRLANDKFFESASLAGWEVTVACLLCDEATIVERRHGRGSNQNPSWLKGRATKVQRLRDRWCHQDHWVFDGTNVTPMAAANYFAKHPAVSSLLGQFREH